MYIYIYIEREREREIDTVPKSRSGTRAAGPPARAAEAYKRGRIKKQKNTIILVLEG